MTSPAFFSRQSGLKLEHRVADACEAAQLLNTRLAILRQNGLIFALPPPIESALSLTELEQQISAAQAAALEKGIRGKEQTPYLLAQLAHRTDGKTLKANVDLLVQNARFAGQLAMELRRLQGT
jgi:pseudouridylate synthase